MINNTLNDYKKTIREKFELEKNGSHADTFLSLSRAKLRKLCFELFQNISNTDDLKIFETFLGFPFTLDCKKKLNDETDKFRPIEKFLKGESDPTDITTLNMAAILVDSTPRPYLKFSKTPKVFTKPENIVIDTIIDNNAEIPETLKKWKETSRKIKIEKESSGKDKKKLKLIIMVSIIIFIIVSLAFIYLPKKRCMEWQEDHYEIVDCQLENNGLVRVPYDQSQIDLRRIWPCDTTTFFKDGKAILWYCKSGKEIELYNKPGFDPVFDKPLKAVTHYILTTHFSHLNNPQATN
ncbi:hypothetical protein [Flavobacterium agrisoli]|uniref:Uncharacterized protein n=1 Tax=Flavobacterium agrisoli TaxID=2793066 RepID=A0A934PKY0_9FLAO|nr:hypothetical protein [Flavobacterium agrisoli]MBK0370077.1 hypothetical protein [Flavobacterium agrisoli]